MIERAIEVIFELWSRRHETTCSKQQVMHSFPRVLSCRTVSKTWAMPCNRFLISDYIKECKRCINVVAYYPYPPFAFNKSSGISIQSIWWKRWRLRIFANSLLKVLANRMSAYISVSTKMTGRQVRSNVAKQLSLIDRLWRYLHKQVCKTVAV